MVKKDIRKIAIGVALIVLSIVCGLAAFYVPDGPGDLFSKEPTSLREKPAAQTPTPLAPPEEKTQGPYDKNQQNKKEGFLWVDQKSSRLVVTLGTTHGLRVGKYLTVYEGTENRGQVAVDTPFETISYVHPVEKVMNLSQNNYYRVVIE